MPTKNFPALPDPLQYLQPFADSLAKLPRGSLNEDVDASSLFAALRERIRGLGEGAATERINQDRETLESWLRTTGDKEHVGYWIHGYLSADELVKLLLSPPPPTPTPPIISIEPPPGWKAEAGPFWLRLKKRGMPSVNVLVINESSFQRSLLEREKTLSIKQRGIETTTRFSDFESGPCKGRKFVWERISPGSQTRIDYLLRVPGGYVWITLQSAKGSFDESGIEGMFGTLRLSMPT